MLNKLSVDRRIVLFPSQGIHSAAAVQWVHFCERNSKETVSEEKGASLGRMI